MDILFNEELLKTAKENADRYGVPMPASIPEPALVPHWFWGLQHAFHQISNGVVPDIDYPLVVKSYLGGVEHGAETTMEHFRGLFQLMKVGRSVCGCGCVCVCA